MATPAGSSNLDFAVRAGSATNGATWMKARAWQAGCAEYPLALSRDPI